MLVEIEAPQMRELCFMTHLKTKFHLWRHLTDWLLLSTNQKRTSGTCQSVRRVYLVWVWGERWVSASVWWAISWLTDGVLNDWWGGWFGRVRWRPWADRLNPSSLYRLNIKVALSFIFVTSILQFFLFLLWCRFIFFLTSHFLPLSVFPRPSWLCFCHFPL